MNILESCLKNIKASDREMQIEVKEFWDALGKPLGSLGTLEDLAIQIGGITGKLQNKVDKKAIIVMASDNGIYEENIASSPQEFTAILAENTAKGITGVSTIAKYVNSDVFVVDVGIMRDLENETIINRKIAYGTKNFLKESAMSYEDAIKAIEIGIEETDRLCNLGYNLIGVGELGVANTTTSSAVLTALTGLDVDITCGVGAGLTSEQLELKKRVIKEAIEFHKPDQNDPIDIISKVGGFDIAAMCGSFLSAAKNKVPVVIDGFISTIAAICAVRLDKNVKDYIIPSHQSKETGAIKALEELELEPMVNLKMRLGEGSGCPLAFQIIDLSLFIQENIGTFEDLNIDSSILLDMRKK